MTGLVQPGRFNGTLPEWARTSSGVAEKRPLGPGGVELGLEMSDCGSFPRNTFMKS